MGKLSEKQREGFGRIVAISILLHVALAALIFVKLPHQLPLPEENAVKVELVPPPEEKPPPPPKQEEAKKPDPPKPPPKPPEPQKKLPIPALQPAVEFGQKDSGPKKSVEGNATEDQAKSTEDKPADQPAEQAAAEPAKPEPPTPAPKPADPQLLATNNPADMKVQLNDHPQDTPPAAEKPAPDPAKPEDKQPNASAKPGAARKLTQARKIFSRSETADPIARLAMGMVSRDVRFDRLCGTELAAQLQNGSPAYNPILWPRIINPRGNVFDLPDGSFRDAKGWRELSFKCEVDSEAMKVVSFAYSVGRLIPRSEWGSRGFLKWENMLH